MKQANNNNEQEEEMIEIVIHSYDHESQDGVQFDEDYSLQSQSKKGISWKKVIGGLLLIGMIGCALFYQSMSHANGVIMNENGNGRQLETAVVPVEEEPAQGGLEAMNVALGGAEGTGEVMEKRRRTRTRQDGSVRKRGCRGRGNAKRSETKSQFMFNLQKRRTLDGFPQLGAFFPGFQPNVEQQLIVVISRTDGPAATTFMIGIGYEGGVGVMKEIDQQQAVSISGELKPHFLDWSRE